MTDREHDGRRWLAVRADEANAGRHLTCSMDDRNNGLQQRERLRQRRRAAYMTGWLTFWLVYEFGCPFPQEGVDSLLEPGQIEHVPLLEGLLHAATLVEDGLGEGGERLDGFADRELESSEHQGVQAARRSASNDIEVVAGPQSIHVGCFRLQVLEQMAQKQQLDHAATSAAV
jgi:hypothetical protein